MTEKSKLATKSLDDFLCLGRYTLLFALFCELAIINEGGNLVFMVFGGAPPSLSCQGNEINMDLATTCEKYHNGTCNIKMEYEFFSVNNEWGLHCGDAHSVKDSTSYQMAGFLFGSVFIGKISDAYGRKWPTFICCLLTGIFGVATAFSPNILIFTILRTLTSFFYAGQMCVLVVYMCEIFPKRHRMWLTYVLSWSPNIVVVTIIAYFCKDWVTFSIVINAIAFLACGVLYFIHDSPHWLVRKGRMDEARRAIETIHRIDGKDLDVKELAEVLDNENAHNEKSAVSHQNYSFQHLVYTWRLAAYSFTMVFGYFAISIVNYGIMFNMETVSGSLYLNMMFVGGIRFLLNVVSAIAEFNISCVGRRSSHLLFAGYTALAVVVILVFQVLEIENDYEIVIRTLILTAGCAICQIYTINGVIASEIFPTEIRNLAFSVMQLAEGLATVLGPQLFLLSQLQVNLPYFVMLLLIIIDLITFYLWIPESKGQNLVDTMPGPEERIFRRKKIVHNELC